MSRKRNKEPRNDEQVIVAEEGTGHVNKYADQSRVDERAAEAKERDRKKVKPTPSYTRRPTAFPFSTEPLQYCVATKLNRDKREVPYCTRHTPPNNCSSLFSDDGKCSVLAR